MKTKKFNFENVIDLSDDAFKEAEQYVKNLDESLEGQKQEIGLKDIPNFLNSSPEHEGAPDLINDGPISRGGEQRELCLVLINILQKLILTEKSAKRYISLRKAIDEIYKQLEKEFDILLNEFWG